MSNKSRIMLNTSADNSSSVKVFEPFHPETIRCENKDEFNLIYNAHKEKYNEMTTQKLNKIFEVPGYKISRVNNEICLRSIKPCEKITSNDNADILQKLTERIDRLEKAFSNLATAHNGLNKDFEDLVKCLQQAKVI